MRLLPVERLAVESGWRPEGSTMAELSGLVAPLGWPDWRVELVWVDDEEMSSLNGRWRGSEGLTDVLSFSNLSVRGDGKPALPAGAGGAATDLWRDDDQPPADAPVGEIVIAPRYVRRRCAERGWDFAGELALLVVHGVLHVLGWTHDTPAAAAAMRELERGILARGGRRHPLLDADGPTAT